MGNVANLPAKPVYIRVKARVARVGYFMLEGFIFFGPFRSETAALAWHQDLYENLEPRRNHGSITLDISIDGFTFERDVGKIYHLHNIEGEAIKKTATIVPNLLLRETHLAYQFLSEVTYGQGAPSKS